MSQGIWGAQYRWVTIGMLTLMALFAFEELAVTTVMPTISAELDGKSLYALAFSGPLAISVIGMVLAGNWADRSGPQGPVCIAGVLFAASSLIAGTATVMPVLVLGRLFQGLGGGAMIVGFYVIVARHYPERLHPRIFAGFAAAWVVPSLVGPLIAGVITENLGWRWVFLGVVALVVVAMIMIFPVMRSFVRQKSVEPWHYSRILWSIIAGVAVLAANLAAEAPGPLKWILAVAAIVIVLIAIRPLLPRGSLQAARGLPTIILLRGLLSGAYLASEVYLPYFLISEYALTPALAGLALSVGGVSWAVASWVQGRFSSLWNDVLSIRLGVGLVLIAIVLALVCSVIGANPIVAILGWVFAGAGMGTVYPRISVLTLRGSTSENQGFNSSALQISDSIGAAVALALTAAIFQSFLIAGGSVAFTGCFVLSAILGLGAFALSGRARLPHVAADA